MIPIEEAEKILSGVSAVPDIESIALPESLGRILAQDIVSAISMPPFDKSAMDGYALISGDNSGRFEVVDIIAAGQVPQKTITAGQCAKIMTGAMVPPGADRVVKVEVTEEKDGFMTITGEDPRENICKCGEDVKPGDVLLTAGHIIRPPEVGIIASMGLDRVQVYKAPVVGIITTGSEIREPGQPLQPGQIYNSNAYSIGAQASRIGAKVVYAGIVSDDIADIRDRIGHTIKETQVVLISGGVSMGDYDFVPRILKDLGVKLYFDKVAIQPGKPTVFGSKGDTLVFGMPGNPVSTFVIFEIFVRSVLCRLMGYDYKPVEIKGVMARDFTRKRKVRAAYVPVQLNRDNEVEPVEYHGSAHLSALSKANGLIQIPRGVSELKKGTHVYVRQI